MINGIFESVELDEEQEEKIKKIKERATEIHGLLCELCPDDYEFQIAETRLEECVMWATKGIAHERDYGIDSIDWKVER